MKTFFKEHIVNALILNLPYTIAISTVLLHLKLESLFFWSITIIIHGVISLNTVKSWYREEQFDKLQKRVKELEDKYENRT